MTSHTGPILEGRGDTDYERYVRVPELLELQKPKDKLVNPDEALFQTTHQAAELWLAHIDFERHRIADAIATGEISLAADLLNRSRLLIDLLREQIIVLRRWRRSITTSSASARWAAACSTWNAIHGLTTKYSGWSRRFSTTTKRS